jgi:uncharacterized protein YycO
MTTNKQIEVVFFKSSGLVASLIRFFTFSPWNHVGIIVDGNYYDTNLENGVSKNYMWYFHNSDKRHSIKIKAAQDQIDVIEKWVEETVGSPYDLKAIFAFPFRKDWHTEYKFFCSEFVAQALEVGNVINITKTNRVTPRDLFYMLNQVK